MKKAEEGLKSKVLKKKNGAGKGGLRKKAKVLKVIRMTVWQIFKLLQTVSSSMTQKTNGNLKVAPCKLLI